ncbi:response regulator [Maribacter sp. ACAM166]|uniref:response regulator n=1 Tax=Maribacter sp. ACAM166 TaxID=2508996 RepID=UPI0010FF49AC|nr:response regulator [Maribacter sp. ACAM166]TLP81726.1 response regulator [Maribacter sp. ACAM166]
MKKILLIEDNKDVRENTADILEFSNYTVATAENGKIGIEKGKQFHPDVILCDIMMPVMDGYEVLDALSKDATTAGIPFIFLTARTDRSDFRKGMNLGADDYLTKPFEELELLDAIESRLKKNDFLRKEFSRNIKGINDFFQDAGHYLNLETISRDYRPKTYKKKDFIFMEGDGAHTLYLIESGTAKTYKSTESGKEFITGILKAGDFMGQLSLMNQKGTYLESAMVMEDSEVYHIPKSDFIHLLNDNKEVAQKFMDIIGNNLAEVQEQLVNMAYSSVRQRVAKTLLNLYAKGIIKDLPNEGIDIPREDFAGIVGTATETAIRSLSEFKEEGLITMGRGRRIVLLDKEELRHIADVR